MSDLTMANEKESENTLQQDKNGIETMKQTKTLWNVFVSYLQQKKVGISVDEVTKHELDKLLCKFWVEVRRIDGTYYKKTSFRALRYAIQRHMKAIRGESFDIIENEEFAQSNNVYNAQVLVLKKCGFAKIDHHQAISGEDMKRLYSSDVLSLETPIGLQRKVFFELMLHLCRRDSENLRDMTVNDFVVIRKNGVECVMKASDERKNHQKVGQMRQFPSTNHDEDEEKEEENLMIATGTSHCPVAAFKLYVEKLDPTSLVFFQRPKANVPPSGPWYDNIPVGVKALARMMKKISADANLSETYTNHCIRAMTNTVPYTMCIPHVSPRRDIDSTKCINTPPSTSNDNNNNDNRNNEQQNVILSSDNNNILQLRNPQLVFGEMVAIELTELSSERQNHAKHEIYNILYKYRAQEEEEKKLKRTQHVYCGDDVMGREDTTIVYMNGVH